MIAPRPRALYSLARHLAAAVALLACGVPVARGEAADVPAPPASSPATSHARTHAEALRHAHLVRLDRKSVV